MTVTDLGGSVIDSRWPSSRTLAGFGDDGARRLEGVDASIAAAVSVSPPAVAA